MKRRSIVVSLLALVLTFAFGASAATVQQVMRPDNVGLVLTGVDVGQTEPLQGFDVGLWMLTPDFKGAAQVLGLTSAVVVVQDDVVKEIRTGADTQLPEVPEVPQNGYILLGSGVGHTFLTGFKVGDSVTIVTKESSPVVRGTEIVAKGTQAAPISAYDRGRNADELIIYTSDFGTHTLTNQFGQEAAVVDGVVVAMRPYGTTDLFEIPENGFVISIHGAARFWYEGNISVGVSIELK